MGFSGRFGLFELKGFESHGDFGASGGGRAAGSGGGGGERGLFRSGEEWGEGGVEIVRVFGGRRVVVFGGFEIGDVFE